MKTQGKKQTKKKDRLEAQPDVKLVTQPIKSKGRKDSRTRELTQFDDQMRNINLLNLKGDNCQPESKHSSKRSSNTKGSPQQRNFDSQISKDESQISANNQINVKIILKPLSDQKSRSLTESEIRINQSGSEKQKQSSGSPNGKPERRLKGLKKNISLIQGEENAKLNQEAIISPNKFSQEKEPNNQVSKDINQHSHQQDIAKVSKDIQDAKTCGRKRTLKQQRQGELRDQSGKQIDQKISPNQSHPQQPLPETRLRHSRQMRESMNYSIFFEDFDSLSEQEEIKRKRDQKRTKQEKLPAKKSSPIVPKNEDICVVLTKPKLSILQMKDFEGASSKHSPPKKKIPQLKAKATQSISDKKIVQTTKQAPSTKQDEPRKRIKKAVQKDKVELKSQKKTLKQVKPKENAGDIRQDMPKDSKKEELKILQQTKVDKQQTLSAQKQVEEDKDESKVQEEPERKEFCMAPITVKGQTVKNPFEQEIRTQALSFIDFNNLTTENNQYRPALIQKEQQDVNKIATHFIHKKQSQCNIKRISGVSYIKKSESKQLHVKDNYEKLAPIVIQGSYNLPKLEDASKIDMINKFCDDIFYSPESYLVCTAIESGNEVAMKNYILKPHKRLEIVKGNIWVIKSGGLSECWKFIKDKFFLCIHFIYDSEQGLRNINPEDLNDAKKVEEFIYQSDICMGMLTKRGNASIKSMLKVYKIEGDYNEHIKHSAGSKDINPKTEEILCTDGSKTVLYNEEQKTRHTPREFDIASKLRCPGANIQGINTIALMTRMELYVDEERWRSATQDSKMILNTLINLCEEKIISTLYLWNELRSQVVNNGIVPNNSLYKIQLKIDKGKAEKRGFQKWEDIQLEKRERKLTPLQDCHLSRSLYTLDNNPIDIMSQLKNSFPIPLTLINTRDCFVYDLYVKETMTEFPGRKNVIKREYYFHPDNVPENFRQVVGLPKEADMNDVENLRVGVTSYENFYTNEELKNMEKHIEETEQKSLLNGFLPMTAQKTFSGSTLKRTKFFFGYRYMWTKTQLLEPLSNVAAGVRADVSKAPVWTKTILEDPLVKAGIIEDNFINSIALNVYHDGSEGLAQHFDDATRFKQPIFTLRLFSDSRLSFGSQYYGFCNGAFFVHLPRGCVCVMEEGSYSANGVKHCIRPCDMTGKSSAVILRQMHPNVVREAIKYDMNVDLPMWMSSLSLQDDSIPYYQQKESECEAIELMQQMSSGNFNPGETRKRGPRQNTSLLEKRIQKQQQKDEKEVKRLMEDMIRRLEVKKQEEREFYQKFTIQKPSIDDGHHHNTQSSSPKSEEDDLKQSAYESRKQLMFSQDSLNSTHQIDTSSSSQFRSDNNGSLFPMLPSIMMLPPFIVKRNQPR